EQGPGAGEPGGDGGGLGQEPPQRCPCAWGGLRGDRGAAPGPPDPGPAVESTRLTALAVLSFGIAGYFSAALRGPPSFVPPAAIFVSYNLCIMATMVAMMPMLYET
ncbi:hypothetical protein ADK93_08670, partial [Streptomyces sp. XY58]